MPIADQRKPSLIGTSAYDNWRAYHDNQPLLSTSEYLLYTDSWLTGEVTAGLGPYRFFNLVPIHRFQKQRGYVCASVALRIGFHVYIDAPDMTKTDQLRYHGGGMVDEITALASLQCGVRLRPGGYVRTFENGSDPQGRLVGWDMRAEPVLSMTSQGILIPDVTGEHSLMPVQEMNLFPLLSPQASIALVRSARLYQDALWLAESEPNLSWLLLVSAVETAATFWSTSHDPPLERLKAARPWFVEYLDNTGVNGLASRVADEFVDSIGAAKKFVDFLMRFKPPPPQKRPAEWGQLGWDDNNLRNAFRCIYGHRSKALHDGIPFPAPMCEAPYRHTGWQAVAEKPIALAASTQGGTWLAKDTPMLLCTFEYIARNALNSWWLSMGKSHQGEQV